MAGQVVRVVDGDTVVALDSGNVQHRIRLAGIDAPERKQPFGRKSTDFMKGLLVEVRDAALVLKRAAADGGDLKEVARDRGRGLKVFGKRG